MCCYARQLWGGAPLQLQSGLDHPNGIGDTTYLQVQVFDNTSSQTAACADVHTAEHEGRAGMQQEQATSTSCELEQDGTASHLEPSDVNIAIKRYTWQIGGLTKQPASAADSRCSCGGNLACPLDFWYLAFARL